MAARCSGFRPESALELVTVGQRSDGVVRHWFGPEEPDLGRPTPPIATLIGTRVDEQSVKPGIEPLRITQARQVTPGVDEGLLHGILRRVDITEDQSGDREQSIG
jgi:hypothetical protein